MANGDRQIYVEIVLDDGGAEPTLKRLDQASDELTQSVLQQDAAFKKLSGSLGEITKASVVTKDSAVAIAQGYIQASMAAARYHDAVRQAVGVQTNFANGLNGAAQRVSLMKGELLALARGGLLAKQEIERAGGMAKMSAGKIDEMSTKVAASVRAYADLGRAAPPALVRLQGAITRTQAENAKFTASYDALRQKLAGNNQDLAKGAQAHTQYQKATAQTTSVLNTLSEGAMVRAVAIGTALGQMFYDLARGAISAFIGTIGQAISESARFNNTLIGLETVAGRLGESTSAAKEAARELASDGLMTVAEAAMGLKNLLASGFGLPEAIKLMQGLKDTAAFNRQGMYELGYAVVSATEGIKNQNSTLVDNAGLTKNLSVIMREAGLNIEDMARISTDAGVRGKFLGGIMKELSLFAGDAAKYAETYSGAVSKLKAQWTLALVALGDAVTQNKDVARAVSLAGDAVKALTDYITENKDTVAGWVSGVASTIIDTITTLVDLWKEWGDEIVWVADNIVAETFKIAVEDLNELADAVRNVVAAYNEATGGTLGAGIQNIGYLVANAIIDPFTKALVAIELLTQKIKDFVFIWERAKQTFGLEGAPQLPNIPVTVPGLYDPVAGPGEAPKGLKPFGPTLEEMQGPKPRTGPSSASKDAERLSKQINELVKDLKAAEKAGYSAEVILEKYGSAIKSVVFEATVSGRAIPEAINKWAKAAHDADLAGVMLKIAETTRDIARPEVERFWKEQEALADETIKAVVQNYELGKDAFVRMQDAIVTRQMSSKQQRVRLMEQELQYELGLLDTRVGNWEDAMAQILMAHSDAMAAMETEQFDAMVRQKKDLKDAAEDAERLFKQMEESGLFTTDELREAYQAMVAAMKAANGELRDSWGEALDGMAATFAQMAQIVGGKLGGLIGQIANLIGALKMAKDAGRAMKDAIAGPGTNWGQMLGGIAQGIAALDQATSTGNRLKNMAGGAMVGAQMGSAFGPIGTGVGAVIGGLIGAFRGPAKASADLKRQFAKDMQDIRKEAELAGADLQRAFDAKYAHEFEQAVKDVEEALANYQKQLEQIGRASGGLDQRVEGFATPFAKIRDEIAAKEDEAIGYYDRGDDKAGDKAVKELEELRKKAKTMTTEAQDDFERVGAMAQMQFGIIVRMTGSIYEAFKQVGPSLDTLIALQKEFGFTAGESLQRLLSFRDVVMANEDIAMSIDGITTMYKELDKAGQLNREHFKLFVADAGALYNDLIARNVDHNDAMLMLQPTLQALWEGQQKYGEITDETTKKLVDQAVEQGLVGEHMKSVNEKILSVLLLIAEVLGADIPDALKGAASAAEESAGRTEDAWKDAEKAVQDYEESVRNLPKGDGVAGPEVPSGGGGEYHWGGVVKAHSGLYLGKRGMGGRGAMNLASGEVPIIAQTGEYVVSRKGVKSIGVDLLDKINAGRAKLGNRAEGATSEAYALNTTTKDGSGGGVTIKVEKGAVQVSTIDKSGFDNDAVADGIFEAVSKRIEGSSKSAIRFVRASEGLKNRAHAGSGRVRTRL